MVPLRRPSPLISFAGASGVGIDIDACGVDVITPNHWQADVHPQRLLLFLSIVLATAPAHVLAQQLRVRSEDPRISSTHLTLFFGGSTEAEPQLGGTSLTFGGDIEYRPFDLVGTGIVVDVAVGEIHRDVLVAVPFFLHATRYFRLTMGLGAEFAAGDELDPDNGISVSGAFRMGGLYQIRFGRLSVAPAINMDLLDADEVVLVYGVAIGLGL